MNEARNTLNQTRQQLDETDARRVTINLCIAGIETISETLRGMSAMIGDDISHTEQARWALDLAVSYLETARGRNLVRSYDLLTATQILETGVTE